MLSNGRGRSSSQAEFGLRRLGAGRGNSEEEKTMATIKSRLERLEEKQWQKQCEELDRYLKGRSLEDVEFFAVHGYLPEEPIPGEPYAPGHTSWEEYKLLVRGRSDDELKFYAVHGYWPENKAEATD
jgi:hypothetical protein